MIYLVLMFSVLFVIWMAAICVYLERIGQALTTLVERQSDLLQVEVLGSVDVENHY